MKLGFAFNCIQTAFSWAYALATGNEPYPLRTLASRDRRRFSARTVLDIGCGSGRFAMSDCDYVGIDPNPYYVAYCRRHCSGRFEQMSGEQVDFPDRTFDLVLAISVGHHIPDAPLSRTLAEAHRVLADDGMFLFIDVVRPIAAWRWAARLLEWLDEGDSFRSESAYLALLKPRFTIVEREMVTDQFYRTLVLRCRKS